MPARLDFKAIAESVDITEVATHLGATLKANRAPCPYCETEDPRSLQIYPETNSFHCWASKASGDAISLWAHLKGYEGQYRAAKELHEQFGSPAIAEKPTAPQKPEGRTESVKRRTQPAPTKPHAFDPEAYAERLVYNDEVAALGLSEEEAHDLGIGYASKGLHKGIAFALRWPSGEIAAFASVIGGQVKLPKMLIPPKVVQLKRA